MKPIGRTLSLSLAGLLAFTLPFGAHSQAVSAGKNTARQLAPSDAEAQELKLFQVSQALLLDPQNPELLLQKGVYLSNLGRLAAALEVFEGLRQAHPNHPAPYANLASVYARMGRLEEARQMLLKSDSLQGNRFQTQLSLASVNLELALAALSKANQINPGDRATEGKLRALEKYLAEANRGSFSSGRPSTPMSREAVAAAATKVPADMSPRSQAKARAQAPEVNRRDRLSLGAPDLGDEARVAPAPQPSVTESGGIPVTGSTDARKKEVLKTVEAWATAWAHRNYEDYAALYSAEFVPADGLSREAWSQRKKSIMDKSSYIQVTLRVNDVQFNGNTATVTLSQKYRSDHYADRGRKELRLTSENGQWKIMEEKAAK